MQTGSELSASTQQLSLMITKGEILRIVIRVIILNVGKSDYYLFLLTIILD